LMGAADVGVGALALERKNMREAQPIKTRHYLGSGLPVIIGYQDTLLDESSPGVFYAHDTAELIGCLQSLKDARNHLRDPIYRKKIRAFALERLSWQGIAKNTSDLLIEALSLRRPS